jgi:hypothetical protein
MKPEGEKLAARYFESAGDEQVQLELQRYLASNPDDLREFVELLRDHAAMTFILGEKEDRLPSLVMSALDFRRTRDRFTESVEAALRDRPAPARPSTRRHLTRGWGGRDRRSFLPALAAAGILFGIVVLASLSPSSPRRLATKPDRPAPGVEPREAEPIPPRQETARKAPEPTVAPSPKPEARPPVEPRTIQPVQEPEKKPALKEKEEKQERPDPPRPEPAPPPKAQDRPGTVAAATAPVLARVEWVEGEVHAVGQGTRTLLKAGDDLRSGQGVEAGPKASALIVYRDQTKFVVGSDTAIREFDERPVKDAVGKWLRLDRGSLWAQVRPQRRPMEIGTPHAVARVLGTTLRLVVDPDPGQGTRLEVVEGKVRLTRLGDPKPAEVASGQFAVAVAGGELAVKPLPIDEIVLSARRGRSIPGIYGRWALRADKECSTGIAMEGFSFGPAQDLKKCAHVEFRFAADAEKDYHVWIRGCVPDTKNALLRDHLILEAADCTVAPSPPGALAFGHASFNGFCERPGKWWWVGGDIYGPPDNWRCVETPVRLRFARPGLQTLRLYAWEGPMGVDALWLSTTQDTRPEEGVLGPKDPFNKK